MIDLSFHPVGGDSYLMVVGAALVLAALLALGPARARTTRGRRWALVGLRLAVIVLVVLAMLRPTVVYTEIEKQSATLVVLADQSKSMKVNDEANGKSRFEAMGETIQHSRDALRALAEDFELRAYTFDAELHPAEVSSGRIALGDTPDGEETAIGLALKSVLDREAGKRLLGIVLLSDGAQRTSPRHDFLPQKAAGLLRDRGCPVYTVRFGQPRGLGQVQDVAVTELWAEQLVFVKNKLVVTGQVRIDGYVNRDVRVQLRVETAAGTEELPPRNLKATSDGQLIPVEFAYVPQIAGEIKLMLEAAAQPGEMITTNNRLSTFVNVLKGGIRVVYIEGFPPRPEQKFLAIDSLGSSPDIHVDVRNLNLAAPQTKPKDLGDLLKPGKSDVYILGDIDSTAFSKTELTDLAAAVDQGAGLMMLGGAQSFGAGGYWDTPLAQVLPVLMDRLQRQLPSGPIRKDLHLPGPLKMQLTQGGEELYNLLPAESREQGAAFWNQLPPLDGANKVTERRGASILAVDQQGRPLLISGAWGKGRVMAFAGDSTWRWWMHGFDALHKRFWRQTVLWLARKDESMEGNVWVKLPQRRFNPWQRVDFTVGAQTANGEPIQGVAYSVEIESPDFSRHSPQMVHSGGQAAGYLRDTQQAGDYTIRVTARQGEKAVGKAQARFSVIEQDLELDNAAADATLLNSLAAMTKGQSVLPEELPGVIRRLAANTQELEVRREATSHPCHTWPFLVGMIGLLGSEWYLRKRWGLV